MPAAFEAARFRELLTTRAFGRNLIFRPSVGSTMDLAREAAHEGAPEGTLALADEQTAGRGRLGRSWITPPASTLASTLVLRPPTGVLRQVAMIAPLAVARAVESVVGLACDIKWPNDVQIGGRKLAGILIEVEEDDGEPVVLVGAGINVNFDPSQHEEIRDIATSLLAELGCEVEREPLLAEDLRHFEDLYDAAKSGASVRDEWRRRLVTLGRRVVATHPGGVIEGVAEDVDHDGSLILLRDDGRRETIEAGDVTLR